jgi:hypothetical protein
MGSLQYRIVGKHHLKNFKIRRNEERKGKAEHLLIETDETNILFRH